MTWELDNFMSTTSYVLTKPYGSALLERCASDRGNWRLTFDFTNLTGVAAICQFVSGMYYFDLENGKAETERWLALGESQPCVAGEKAALKKNLNELSIESVTFGNTHLLPGKLCILSIQEVISPISLFIASPAIPAGVDLFLNVDESDRFPRHYTDETVARRESIAWMNRRGQLITEIFVEARAASLNPNGVFFKNIVEWSL